MIQSFQQQSTIMEFAVACTDSKPMALPDNFQPRDTDILCGRGRGVWEHPGNRRFKSLIEAHAEKYSTARNKMDKGVVIASIVDSIREEGILFVKKDAKTQSWLDIGEYQAREKTSHAMRDHISKANKKTTQQSTIKQLKPQKKQQPTVDREYQPVSVSSCHTADKCVSDASISTRDIFQRLGLDYFPVFAQEKTVESIYPDKATSHGQISEDEETLRWSELFPIDAFDQFEMEHSCLVQ